MCVDEEKMGSYLQPIKSPLIASASGLGRENQWQAGEPGGCRLGQDPNTTGFWGILMAKVFFWSYVPWVIAD